MESNEQPFDYRYQRGSTHAHTSASGAGMVLGSRSSCMEPVIAVSSPWPPTISSKSFQGLQTMARTTFLPQMTDNTNWTKTYIDSSQSTSQLSEQMFALRPSFDQIRPYIDSGQGKGQYLDSGKLPNRYDSIAKAPYMDLTKAFGAVSNALDRRGLDSPSLSHSPVVLCQPPHPDACATPTPQLLTNHSMENAAGASPMATVTVKTEYGKLSQGEESVEEQLSPSLILQHTEADDEETDDDDDEAEEDDDDDEAEEDFDANESEVDLDGDVELNGEEEEEEEDQEEEDVDAENYKDEDYAADEEDHEDTKDDDYVIDVLKEEEDEEDEEEIDEEGEDGRNGDGDVKEDQHRRNKFGSKIRRSGRKRRSAVTYFDEDFLDLEIEEAEMQSRSRHSNIRKKRKSSKPHRVTQSTEAWPELEADEQSDSALPSSGGKRQLGFERLNKKMNKSNHVYFSPSMMQRFYKLKADSGVVTNSAFINRMMNLMDASVHGADQTAPLSHSHTYQRASVASGKKNKKFRYSIHDELEVFDEFGNVKNATDCAEPQANLCLRTSPDVKRCWLELIAHSKLSSTSFLAHLLMLYTKWHDLDMSKDETLKRADERRELEIKNDIVEICACEPQPEKDSRTDDSETDAPRRKKNRKIKLMKKTKEVEQIDEKDYIVHHIPSVNASVYAQANSGISAPVLSAATVPETIAPPNDKHRVTKFYECGYCHKMYKSWSIFYHLRQHKLSRDQYLCKTCDKQLPIRQPKRLKEQAKCLYCEFKTFYRPVMRSHLREVHREQCKPGKKYRCDTCSKEMKSASALRDHRHCHAPGSADFVCDLCNKRFANRRFLRVHMTGVHGNRKYVCDQENCSRRFNTKNMLSTHIKRVHLKVRKVDCPNEGCMKKFFSRCELAQHTRVYHTKEKCFSCTWEGCGKSFRAPYHLQVHMRIHTDEKPLKCPHCDYRARQRNALNWHLKKHGEGPHHDKVGQSKPRQARAARPKPNLSDAQHPMTHPHVGKFDHDLHVGVELQAASMYTPQFHASFDYTQNLHHGPHTHTHPFTSMEALYHHPQMQAAFPQAIPQSSAHSHNAMQYQTL